MLIKRTINKIGPWIEKYKAKIKVLSKIPISFEIRFIIFPDGVVSKYEQWALDKHFIMSLWMRVLLKMSVRYKTKYLKTLNKKYPKHNSPRLSQ